jgi:hypothetical protein
MLCSAFHPRYWRNQSLQLDNAQLTTLMTCPHALSACRAIVLPFDGEEGIDALDRLGDRRIVEPAGSRNLRLGDSFGPALPRNRVPGCWCMN